MSTEIKLILMIGGSALKFHLNQVASQGKLGIPPIFGLSNGSTQQANQNQMGSQSQQNPNMMEQMRQQAQMQQMLEQTHKQNEILAEKSKNEHNLELV